MTPDQPATPAGLHPETAVICAGRPSHTVLGDVRDEDGSGVLGHLR
jgi:hypothetical protein